MVCFSVFAGDRATEGPDVDLNKVLQEMRAQYESRMEKNQQELETWFQSKVRLWTVPLRLSEEA